MKPINKNYKLESKEKTSHYLSMVLRHRPDSDLKMDKQGWVLVDKMLNKINEIKEFEENFTFEDLKEIVAKDNKQRFALKTQWGKTYIRANQGHSKGLGLEMDYKPVTPPDILYHGTGEKYVKSILENGLISKTRLFVHLSPSKDIATTVGTPMPTSSACEGPLMQTYLSRSKYSPMTSDILLCVFCSRPLEMQVIIASSRIYGTAAFMALLTC
jgi:putative RNA 2'-phosphotransferase